MPQPATEGQADEGIGSKKQGQADEGDEEGSHFGTCCCCCCCGWRQPLRSSLWTRLRLPGTSSPLSSSLKRKIVVSCPSKVRSTADSTRPRTVPSAPWTATLALTGTGKRRSAER